MSSGLDRLIKSRDILLSSDSGMLKDPMVEYEFDKVLLGLMSNPVDTYVVRYGKNQARLSKLGFDTIEVEDYWLAVVPEKIGDKDGHLETDKRFFYGGEKVPGASESSEKLSIDRAGQD